MRIPYISTFSLLFCALILVQCDQRNDVPDTNDIYIEWDFVPFHLSQNPSGSTTEYMQKMQREHPAFAHLFFNQILPITDEHGNVQEDLLTDDGLVRLIDTCTLIYEDLDHIKNDFNTAFKNYAFHTGSDDIPNVYTFVSGFAYQTFIFDDRGRDGLGVGLDMFIGSDFPYKSIDISNPTFSEYLTQYFDKKYLVRKSLLTWLDDKIPTTQSAALLDIIIRNGKILYILQKLLPHREESILLEYQPDEYTWCLDNEIGLWGHLLKADLLYEQNFAKINKLVNPSPGAPGIPAEAPGAVANYIGWRIVQDYMARTDTSINDLMKETNPQKILDESKYKPRNRR